MTRSHARAAAEQPGAPERSMAVIAVASVLGALAIAGQPIIGVSIVAGLVLTAWAPGAALLLAMGPAAPVRGVARQALAIPLSLSIVALLGVAADRLGLGLRPGVLTLASLAATACLLGMAMFRTHRGRRPGQGAASAAGLDE